MNILNSAVLLDVVLISVLETLCQPTTIRDDLVPQYDPETFSQRISDSPHFILYYVPWCGHCLELMATLDKLAEANRKWPTDPAVTIAKVKFFTNYKCNMNPFSPDEAYINQKHIQLIFYWYNEMTGRKYRGNRDLISLQNYLTSIVEAGPSSELQRRMKKPTLSHIDELTPEIFLEAVSQGQNFVDFYAPWCGHCQKLTPIWDRLREELKEDRVVSVVKVDCTQAKTLCAKQRVKAYPSLYYFSNGQKVSEYLGERSFENLIQFVKEMKIKEDDKFGSVAETVPRDHGASEPKPEESRVLVPELNAEGFYRGVAVLGLKVVLHHVPWCPHCINFIPTFNRIAEHFQNDAVLTFAKVDCSKYQSVCLDQNVLGYPIIVLYSLGQQVVRYGGLRTFESLLSFLTEQKKSQHNAEVKKAESLQHKHSSNQDLAVHSGGLMLTKASYSLKIEVSYTFVNFYQPWCTHCKTLAPEWAKLAVFYSKDKQITIASVNCALEKALCEEVGISSYPTLIMYHDGEVVSKYEGPYSFGAMTVFVERAAGNTKDDDFGEKDEL